MKKPVAEMTKEILQEYDPGKLLDAVTEKLNLENDASLSRALGVTPKLINQIRNRQMDLDAPLLVRMQEETALSIRQLRTLLGEHRISMPSGTSPVPERRARK